MLTVGAGGVAFLTFFSLVYHSSFFSLSLGHGLIITEILSCMAVKSAMFFKS